MRNQYSPIIEKSLEIIKRFEEKFGWFSIRVYQFPQIDGFGTFLESVQRTLLRHRTIGWYMWARIRGTDFYLSILEEVTVDHIAPNREVPQNRRCPLPELGRQLAVDPVSDRNDHIQIVVFKITVNLAASLLANC